MAAATDLPTVSTDGNITWYTIKNVRGNAYAAFTGSGTKMKLNSTIENESYLFYFTQGENGGYKIHNAVTSNLCAGHSSWTAEGINWYMRANSNNNYSGVSISHTADFSGNNSWNDYQNSHTLLDYWSANDDGSAWAIEEYTGDVDALKASKLQMSTNEQKHFYYIKNRRANKYANFVGFEERFTLTSTSTGGSYWYFVDASADLPEGTEVPEGYVACRIYNAGHNLAVENTSGYMSENDDPQWPAKIYFIGKHDNTYWDYVIYPYDETGAGWNNQGGQGKYVANHSFDDLGSIWSIELTGKSESDLINEAGTAKTNALTLFETAELADYFTYSDEAIATAKTAVRDLDVTTDLITATTSRLAIESAISTLKAAETNDGPVEGDCVMLKNRDYGNWLSMTIGWQENVLCGKPNGTEEPFLIWELQATDVDGVYYLYNKEQNVYAGPLPEWDNSNIAVKSTQEEAGKYQFVAIDGGLYAAVYDTQRNANENSYLHHSNWEPNKEIVRWNKASEASQWIVAKVEEPEVEETNLYALQSPTGTYFNFTPVTPTGGKTTYASFQKTPSFLYKMEDGNSYFFEDMNNPGEYVGRGPDDQHWIVSKSNKTLWNISEPDANGFVTISRAGIQEDYRLGHDGNTNVSTGIFTNVGGDCNKWQLIPAYPITIIYKNNSNDEEIETVKTAAIAGTEFSYDIDTKSYEFVSCETDKGNIDVEDGTCTIEAVNGATTITISLAPVQEVVNPDAVVALVNRIGGIGTSNNFKFVHDRSLNGETFVIGAEEGKILIKGSTISAITTGIGWYLNNIAHINIAWNSLNEKTTTVKWDPNAGYADLSHLPLPTTTETHTSDAKYRYYLNYCTFGYSMTSWTWTRWQQEIDWMALHGINMPLQIVGLEEVWRKFLTMKDGSGNSKYNYTDDEAMAFVAGPAFTAWWGMNNLEGWGGTGTDGWGGVQDDAWYKRQQALATQILTLQRDLGMQPVLPGFSGMVPSNFGTKNSISTNPNGNDWGGFTRPHIINPTSDRFAGIAADYYACLKEVMGESQYYSMDPFHEGGGTASNGDYTLIYNAMEAAKPGSQWVIQQWQWDGGSQKLSLSDVPAGKLIVLDLFSDGKPEFDKHGYNGYAPQDAVFCAIPNFGGRSGLMGRLQNVTDNYFTYKAKHKTIKGIGTAPEAIEQTPVTYDLIYQLPWMNGEKPNVEEWVNNYSIARYGKDNTVVKEAWSLLRQGPLNYGADAIQGPVEDVWAARPNLIAKEASSWGATISRNWNGTIVAGNTYTKVRRQMLIDAVYKLIDQEDELELTDGSVHKSNYNYDLVEFGGAVIADYAHDLLLGIKEAKDASNTDLYNARKNAFLQLILDMDEFRGTNLNFRLGKWTQEARDAAKEAKTYGATIANEDWYEFNNARTILTTWGDKSQNSGLKDYSYRSWQGLLADYYYPRWKYYFENNCTDPLAGYFFFEWNWAHGLTHEVGQSTKSTTRLEEGAKGYSYSREPEGNTVEKAVEMLGKYIIPVPMADGTHYAYRYLTNDLSNKVTIIATGNSIDLTQYFGALEGATVTGEFMDGSATDLQNIPLQSNLADGAYTGTITLADGTVLTFGVSVNPKYNGTYKIKYSGDPVFIQYHTVQDNGKNIGYKVVTTKIGNGGSTGYSADYEADQLFTITPSGTGFALSAQGQYLKTTVSSGWNHIMFSEQKGDAGTYTISEPDVNGLVKLKSTNTQGMASVAIYDNGAWGNDEDGKAISFSLEEVTTYAITIPASGYYGLCLPFNVVLPTGVTAYDVTVENLTCGEDGAITSLASIATEGQILKAGTPALLKGTAGNYNLTITMDNTNAKTSSVDSKLRGNFVKQTLAPGILNKFIYTSEGEHPFVRINGEQDIPANTCWIEANIDADNVEVTEYQGKVLKIDDWLFTYTEAGNGNITLVDVVTPGTKDLVIGSYYTINGKTQKVTAISSNFLHDNEVVETVTIPATLTNLGFQVVEPMFTAKYEGAEGDGTTETTTENEDGTTTTTSTTQGANSYMPFPDEPGTNAPWKVSGNFPWRLTLDVKIDNVDDDFNNFGSAIVSTMSNSLADYYTGHMQIYLHKGHKKLVVKINNGDDRYIYGTKVLDDEGNETEEDLVMTKFKFVLDCDGANNYQVVIYYENGKAKMYNISADQNAVLNPFSGLYYSLPEGIHVDVTFEKLRSEGLFVGCTNLQEIIVDPANPTFKSCDHGVLYDKNGYYVMRIPEGEKEHHFEIPSKVVKLYAGSFHGVSADIVLHSNPQIGVVEGHGDAVKNAKFFLSLDDIDGTIAVGETGHGGARDFISTNNNEYQSARYKRAPLAAGKMGTICLPFAPENALDKYDFFTLIGGEEKCLVFSQVAKLEPNTPYLYRLKETPGKMETEDGLDVFEASGFTVTTHAKYDPQDEQPGSYRALGSLVNFYIDTNTDKTRNSIYYYLSASSGKFHRVTERLNYRPYRAYFVVTPENPNQVAAAPARLSLRLLDGTTTDIDASIVEGMETPVYYDLSGRRVLNPGSGVYIVNGKKVFIK